MPYYVHAKDAEPTSGKPFDAQSDAISALKEDPAGLKITFIPTPDQSQEWRERESDRFRNGAYIEVPWSVSNRAWELHQQHYPHLSLKIPGLIAYTKSEEHGVQDRQTRVKPGKYLEEFYSDYPLDQRQAWIAQCSAVHEGLKIATTADDIERVYIGGPSSCMSKSASHYRSQSHPTRVYGGSDLAIAYYGDIDHASARAVVWPDKKRYGRVYGGSGVLEQLLDHAGYAPGDMCGARVRAICENGRYVMPYVDGIDTAGLDGKWFVLGDEGYSVQQTDGIAIDDEDNHDHEFYCDGCGDYVSEDDYRSDDLCNTCWSNRNFTCDNCSGDYDRDDGNTLDNGDILCSDCYSETLSTCAIEDCGNQWHEQAFSRRERRDRENRDVTGICSDCAETHAYCRDCEVYYLLDATDHTIEDHPAVPFQSASNTDDTGSTRAEGIYPDRDLAPPAEPTYHAYCVTCKSRIAPNDQLDLLSNPVVERAEVAA